MKITWITERHPPLSGGMARSSDRLVNLLSDAGFFVKVLHLNARAAMAQGSDKMLAAWHRTVMPGINVPVEPERIFAVCKDEMRETVLVGFGGDTPAYLATLWGKWLGVGSVALFRGNDFERQVHDVKRGWLTHFVLENAGAIGAVSTEMTARIAAMTQTATLFTPNSINTAHWRFFESDHKRIASLKQIHFRDSRPVVALLGQLKTKKGLDLTIRLFEQEGLHSRAYLLSVGDTPTNWDEHKPDFWIKVPFQKGDNINTYYGLADVVFLPSYYDGMPNVLLEAMALGRIVVASRAGGIPDVIEDQINGFLFDVGDIQGARRALVKALELLPDEKERISAAAVQRVQTEFGADGERAAMVELLRLAEKG